jgi:hypothetical protein
MSEGPIPTIEEKGAALAEFTRAQRRALEELCDYAQEACDRAVAAVERSRRVRSRAREAARRAHRHRPTPE